MTRREPLTKKDVEQAIAELIAAGAAPSCRTVRDKLGGGSMTTVARFMRELDQERAAPVAAPVSLSPTQIARAVQMIETLLGELRQDDRIEIERIKRASDERVAAAERRADDLAEAVDAEQRACQQQLDHAAEAAAELRRQLAQAGSDRDGLRTSLIEERALKTQAESAVAQLREERSRLQDRVETLVADVAGLRQQLEGTRALLDERRQDFQRLSSRADGLAEQLAFERLARAQAEKQAAGLRETEVALLERTEELGRMRAERDQALRRRARPSTESSRKGV
jgi:chromosome segregation ATPase